MLAISAFLKLPFGDSIVSGLPLGSLVLFVPFVDFSSFSILFFLFSFFFQMTVGMAREPFLSQLGGKCRPGILFKPHIVLRTFVRIQNHPASRSSQPLVVLLIFKPDICWETSGSCVLPPELLVAQDRAPASSRRLFLTFSLSCTIGSLFSVQDLVIFHIDTQLRLFLNF